MLALDRVPDGAHEDVGLQAALDQVVLGPRRDGGEAGLLLGEAGEDDHGGLGGVGQHLVEGVESVGVGQVQVQQDALRRLALQPGQGLREGARATESDVDPAVRDQLLDEEGVTLVVLDEQDARGKSAPQRAGAVLLDRRGLPSRAHHCVWQRWRVVGRV